VNESACIQDAAKLWNSVVEVGKTNLRQTPEFKLAVKTCLTQGCDPLEIALAIHDIAIADDRYPDECLGKGPNYKKIQGTVYSCKKSLQNQE